MKGRSTGDERANVLPTGPGGRFGAARPAPGTRQSRRGPRPAGRCGQRRRRAGRRAHRAASQCARPGRSMDAVDSALTSAFTCMRDLTCISDERSARLLFRPHGCSHDDGQVSTALQERWPPTGPYTLDRSGSHDESWRTAAPTTNLRRRGPTFP